MNDVEIVQARNLRQAMVMTQLMARGVTDPAVCRVMAQVPRHRFATFASLEEAYADAAFPIACAQTISQPYIVGLMTQALALAPTHRVLEIGTGSGYQTAILAGLVHHVYSIERHPALLRAARNSLADLGVCNVTLIEGDGTLGLPSEAPFDRILAAAAGPVIPPAWQEQLSPTLGILVLPVVTDTACNRQELLKIVRTGPDTYEKTHLGAVRFVPLV